MATWGKFFEEAGRGFERAYEKATDRRERKAALKALQEREDDLRESQRRHDERIYNLREGDKRQQKEAELRASLAPSLNQPYGQIKGDETPIPNVMPEGTRQLPKFGEERRNIFNDPSLSATTQRTPEDVLREMKLEELAAAEKKTSVAKALQDARDERTRTSYAAYTNAGGDEELDLTKPEYYYSKQAFLKKEGKQKESSLLKANVDQASALGREGNREGLQSILDQYEGDLSDQRLIQSAFNTGSSQTSAEEKQQAREARNSAIIERAAKLGANSYLNPDSTAYAELDQIVENNPRLDDALRESFSVGRESAENSELTEQRDMQTKEAFDTQASQEKISSFVTSIQNMFPDADVKWDELKKVTDLATVKGIIEREVPSFREPNAFEQKFAIIERANDALSQAQQDLDADPQDDGARVRLLEARKQAKLASALTLSTGWNLVTDKDGSISAEKIVDEDEEEVPYSFGFATNLQGGIIMYPKIDAGVELTEEQQKQMGRDFAQYKRMITATMPSVDLAISKPEKDSAVYESLKDANLLNSLEESKTILTALLEKQKTGDPDAASTAEKYLIEVEKSQEGLGADQKIIDTALYRELFGLGATPKQKPEPAPNVPQLPQ